MKFKAKVDILLQQIDNCESERLRFRDLEQYDAQRLFQIYSDKEAMKYRGSKPMTTLEDAKTFILNQRLEEEHRYTFRQGIEIKETQELIGSILFRFYKDISTECVIGYSIGADFWNRGFGREIVKLLVEQIKALKNIEAIKAYTRKENIASSKILELNGFKKVAQEEFPNSYLYLKNFSDTDHPK